MLRRLALMSLLAGGLLLCPPPAGGQVIRNHFESDAIARPPAFFDFVVLGAASPAAWRVTAGENPPSAPNYVAQILDSRPKDSIAVAVRRNSSYRDGAWSIALMKVAARGGIVFRMADEKNFLALLVEAETGAATLTAYRNGAPTELAKGAAHAHNEWGMLKITADGPKVSATWDGRPLLEATDPNPAAGRSGMATAGPGVAFFDEFILEPKGLP